MTNMTNMTIKDDQIENSEIELQAGDGTPNADARQGLEDRGRYCDRQVASVSFGPTGEHTTGDIEDDGECKVRFPLPFYDLTTMKVMKDPVVDPEGNSIERPDASNQDQSIVVYYPNRALKLIIQRQVELACPSFVGSLRRIDDVVWKSWSKLVDKSLIGGNAKPLPEVFYCPITAELMVDPVITPNGQTFERMAIEHWVRANGTDPISRDTLTLKSLRRNNNLYQLIQNEKNKNDSVSHPSFRRWKETTTETSRRDDFHYDDEATPDAATNNLPTNHEEIASIRQRQRQSQKGSVMVLLIFTATTLLVVLPYAAIFVVFFLVIILCAFILNHSPNNDTN